MRRNRILRSLLATTVVLFVSSTAAPDEAADPQIEGFNYVRANNFQKALECFAAALKEHPESWIIMQSLANCQMEIGQYDTAIVSLQKSIEVGGLHASQCNNMAAIFQRKGDAKKALNWLKLACKLESTMQGNIQVMMAISKLQDPENRVALRQLLTIFQA